VIERRRKDRIHPDIQITLKVHLNDALVYSLPLVDLSIDGCLFRVPIKNSRKFVVCQPAVVDLTIEEFNMQVHGDVYRITVDTDYPQNKDTALVMIMFGAMERDNKDLQEMIDILGKRW
jgi:hypothetical protein